jgi:hypothetical protein
MLKNEEKAHKNKAAGISNNNENNKNNINSDRDTGKRCCEHKHISNTQGIDLADKEIEELRHTVFKIVK